MDELPDASNKCLTVKGAFKKREYRRKLSSANPVLARHVMFVELMATEDWPTLRRSHQVLLFDLFAVLLLAIGVLTQLSELIGELMAIDLLYRIK